MPDGPVDNVRPLHPKRRGLPALLRQWPITVVLLVMVTALGILTLDHFRRGALLLSASVWLAFFLRLLLPSRDAGLLAVRSRHVDLAVLGVLAGLLTVLTFAVPPPN